MSVMDKFFRHHEESVWSQLNNALEGGVLEKVDGRDDKVVCKVDDWTVMLDLHFEGSYRAEFIQTRFRTFYAKAEYFHFSIHHSHWTDRLVHLLGFHHVEVGHRQFDHDYVLKTNDPERAKRVFGNSELRDLMLQEDDLCISLGPVESVGPDGMVHPGSEEVRMMVEGEVKDPERVRRLYRIFCILLHELFLVFSADLEAAPETAEAS